MQQAQSAGKSFFKWIVSISMALGFLVECELEEKEERGKLCPLLRVMMHAFCLWKLIALPIQALRVSGVFSWSRLWWQSGGLVL